MATSDEGLVDTRRQARMHTQPEPNVAWTVLATLFFGALGIVVSAYQARAATRAGYPSRKYWVAWAVSLAGGVALELLLFYVLISAAASTGPGPDLSWVRTWLICGAAGALAVAFGYWADRPEDRRNAELARFAEQDA